MTKDILDAIKERRSVRKFKNEAVNEATLGRIMKAAIWAPSAGNVQPWQFFVIHNQGIKNKLTEASNNQQSVSKAPVAVVVCADLTMAGEKYGERGSTLYSIQGTACAIQNMMLAATALGLDTLWVGAFDENSVKNIFKLSHHLRPVAIILIGYGEQDPNAPAKRPIDEVIHVIK